MLPTITLNKLDIGYIQNKRQTVVISNINESLKSGELTCLLGANGVGKSTLLRSISAFQPILAGDIKILDKSIEKYSANQLAKVISIVLTQRPKVFNMTVKELVATGRTPYTDFWGTLNSNDTTAIEQALEDIDITHLKNRYINTLSDGEKQKALIAKALAQDTPIILLDEPTAFLDYPSKVEVLQLLQELTHKRNKTVLLSTHDMELAYQIADKIWLFTKDRELITGAPEDLALNGTIDHFFDTSKLFFDQRSGLFKVRNTIKGTVHINSSPHIYPHISRALERLGYIHQEESKIDVTVVCDSPLSIQVVYEDQKYMVHTIAGLRELDIF